VDVLLATARRDPDAQVRRYAIVGLGQRTPARDDEAPGADEARRVIGRFYMGALQGHHVQSADRPWVYLGAALHARRGPAQAGRVIAALRKAASGGGARGTRAAAAIALGLLGGKDATATLRELLATVRDQELRPYAAEALGIARDRESRGLLLALVKGDGTEQVRYRAALGLGYLADRELVGELVTALHGARSVPVRAALTRVIGEVGDRAAIGALAAIAADTKEDALTRGRAIAALGLIGETSEETWVEPFKRGANRAAATPSLRIVLSIF
jgi:HEAT repeat protein